MQTLGSVQLKETSMPLGQVTLEIDGTNNRFTSAFEATGRIIFEASDGEMLEVMIADADMSEPYIWNPTNSSEVVAFATHVQGLSDHNATLTLTDDDPVVSGAPSFADDTGDFQSWTVGVAIAPITVPAAAGNPSPTYAAHGELPSGITFNAITRVLSGTPNIGRSGTITIRATNSGGMDDWTVDYLAALGPISAPSFADDTGDFQSWDSRSSNCTNHCPCCRRQPFANTMSPRAAFPPG